MSTPPFFSCDFSYDNFGETLNHIQNKLKSFSNDVERINITLMALDAKIEILKAKVKKII